MHFADSGQFLSIGHAGKDGCRHPQGDRLSSRGGALQRSCAPSTICSHTPEDPTGQSRVAQSPEHPPEAVLSSSASVWSDPSSKPYAKPKSWPWWNLSAAANRPADLTKPRFWLCKIRESPIADSTKSKFNLVESANRRSRI